MLVVTMPSQKWQKMMERVRDTTTPEKVRKHLVAVDLAPEAIESHLDSGRTMYEIYEMAIGEGFPPLPDHPLI